MALTPEDVVTKQFQHVRFKEGFDPDEVDDFLDEIVVEWRKTIEENEQLKARIAELEGGAPAAAQAPAPTPAPEAAPAPVETPAPAAEAGVSATASNAAGIIARAERLHDEHVAEGQATAKKLVDDAEAKASGIVAAAEAKQREISQKLDTERKSLEGRITELRQFERDYRQQLRGYFEQKLADLNAPESGSQPASTVGL
ncbi:cell division protein DivIVA [Microbacterium sorbitolivorans]|uniref:Cell wall synthesis protein Wag31 n=1 Tax=Microbacterium sorbitolivorans TaxID=1867410 RepID=A0A367Y6L9_9MICO|nr:DivIVA domain-containing protein [Microbacterium sorbitolivorans]RCK61250.1 DivIVA domain-containing protein [Microbacterium sorbitolivorans]GGF33755.1 cell division protein DivIVA [Microbacterium sorbitolivorans]